MYFATMFMFNWRSCLLLMEFEVCQLFDQHRTVFFHATLVMELQEGVTIVVFCASNPISTYLLSWLAVKTGISCVFGGV